MDLQKFGEQLDEVTAFLQKLPQPVGILFGMVNMVKEMVRRHEAGEDQQDFNDNIAVMLAGGGQMVENSEDWFDQHPEYDRATGRRIE